MFKLIDLYKNIARWILNDHQKYAYYGGYAGFQRQICDKLIKQFESTLELNPPFWTEKLEEVEIIQLYFNSDTNVLRFQVRKNRSSGWACPVYDYDIESDQLLYLPWDVFYNEMNDDGYIID